MDDGVERFVIKPHGVRHESSLVTRSDGVEWVLVKRPYVFRGMVAVVVGLTLAALPFVALHLGFPRLSGGRQIQLWMPMAVLGLGLVVGGVAMVRLWPLVGFSLLTDRPETSMTILERRTLMGATRVFEVRDHEVSLAARVVMRGSMPTARKAVIQDPNDELIGRIEEETGRAITRMGVQAAAGWLTVAGRYGAALEGLTRHVEAVRRLGAFDLDIRSASGEPVGYVSIAVSPEDPSIAEVRLLDSRLVLLATAVMAPDRL